MTWFESQHYDVESGPHFVPVRISRTKKHKTKHSHCCVSFLGEYALLLYSGTQCIHSFIKCSQLQLFYIPFTCHLFLTQSLPSSCSVSAQFPRSFPSRLPLPVRLLRCPERRVSTQTTLSIPLWERASAYSPSYLSMCHQGTHGLPLILLTRLQAWSLQLTSLGWTYNPPPSIYHGHHISASFLMLFRLSEVPSTLLSSPQIHFTNHFSFINIYNHDFFCKVGVMLWVFHLYFD